MDEQSAYEQALGAYLVSFNKLEVKLSEVHFGAMVRMGLTHLFRSDSRLIERLVPMEIALKALKWPSLDYDLLRSINGRRNELAHGHLHTDPNTGDLLVEGTHKIKREVGNEYGIFSISRESKVEPPNLAAFSREVVAIDRVMGGLDSCLAHFWFDDVEEPS